MVDDGQVYRTSVYAFGLAIVVSGACVCVSLRRLISGGTEGVSTLICCLPYDIDRAFFQAGSPSLLSTFFHILHKRHDTANAVSFLGGQLWWPPFGLVGRGVGQTTRVVVVGRETCTWVKS